MQYPIKVYARHNIAYSNVLEYRTVCRISPVIPRTIVNPLNRPNPKTKWNRRLHKPSSSTKHWLLYVWARKPYCKSISPDCFATGSLLGLTCAAISDNSIITLFTVDENCGWSGAVLRAISQPHGKIFRDVLEVGCRHVSLPERECVASSPTHFHGRQGCSLQACKATLQNNWCQFSFDS